MNGSLIIIAGLWGNPFPDEMKDSRYRWKLQRAWNNPQVVQALSPSCPVQLTQRLRINTDRGDPKHTVRHWYQVNSTLGKRWRGRRRGGKRCYLIIATGCAAFLTGFSTTQMRMRRWWPRDLLVRHFCTKILYNLLSMLPAHLCSNSWNQIWEDNNQWSWRAKPPFDILVFDKRYQLLQYCYIASRVVVWRLHLLCSSYGLPVYRGRTCRAD